MAKFFGKCCDENNSPHRGRPRCNERHESILKAATNLFMERGFDGTSMDAVAKEAGVSKQTVYSHFSKKENLFSSSITHKMEDYFPDSRLIIESGLSLEEELTIVATQFAALLMSDDAMCVFRLLVNEASKGPHLAEIFWEAGPAVMLARLVNFLNAWQKKGALKIDDTEEAAKLMINLLKGLLHFELSIGLIEKVSDEELRVSVKSSVEVFLKLYRA